MTIELVAVGYSPEGDVMVCQLFLLPFKYFNDFSIFDDNDFFHKFRLCVSEYLFKLLDRKSVV